MSEIVNLWRFTSGCYTPEHPGRWYAGEPPDDGVETAVAFVIRAGSPDSGLEACKPKPVEPVPRHIGEEGEVGG